MLAGLLVSIISVPFVYSVLSSTDTMISNFTRDPGNVGREFYIAFMQNHHISSKTMGYSQITMTTDSNKIAMVTVSTPQSNISIDKVLYVKRHVSQSMNVPSELRGAGTELAFKTVYVNATEDIAVFAMSFAPYSFQTYTALPYDAVGSEYYIMTYYSHATFVIVSARNDTHVEVVFPDVFVDPINVTFEDTRYSNGDKIVLNMKRFQMFHCYQFNEQYADFTGTHISSSYPVTVFSGNLWFRASAKDGNVGNAESVPPVSSWGKRFFTFSAKRSNCVNDSDISSLSNCVNDSDISSLSNCVNDSDISSLSYSDQNDTVRVLGHQPNTSIILKRLWGSDIAYVHAGTFRDFSVSWDHLATIESDKAICVGVFAKLAPESELTPNSTDVKAYPSFAYLIPESLFKSVYTYSTFSTDDGGNPQLNLGHSVILIIKSEDISGLRLDGQVMNLTGNNEWKPIPGSSDYVISRQDIEEGTHTFHHINPIKTFMAIATGSMNFTPYSFPMGTRMAPINLPCTQTNTTEDDGLDNDCDGRIDEELDNSQDDDGDGRVDEDLSIPPRVDGMWSNWTVFMKCSVNCGRKGIEVLHRYCNSPPPANLGLYCQGDQSKYIECDRSDIPCADSDESQCLDGFTGPQCKDCARDWVGKEHCSLPCRNKGTHVLDHSGSSGGHDIVPHYTCVSRVNANEYYVWVGYSNFNGKMVMIPVGIDNAVQGAHAISQETHFRPGFHPYAFMIGPVKLSMVVKWKLQNRANVSGHDLKIKVNDKTPCSDGVRKWNLMELGHDVEIGICKCASGYYGASCENECPGGPDNPCSGKGVCQRHDGRCLCGSRWAEKKYFFDLFTKGYLSDNKTYPCNTCTEGFYGPDCSTAVLTGNVKGFDYVAVAFSSEIITLDGTTLTLVQSGVYRLLETKLLTLDGYFSPCKGRHDCHSLREVALKCDAGVVSFAADDAGATKVNFGFNSSSIGFENESDELKEMRSMGNVIRFTFNDGEQIVVANIEGELMVGVIMPKKNHIGIVNGLLGNADTDWVNDIADFNRNEYSEADLSAFTKATRANSRFRLETSRGTILEQSGLIRTYGSGAFAMRLEQGSLCHIDRIDLPMMSEFSVEFWVKVRDMNSHALLLALETRKLGRIKIGLVNGWMMGDWLGTYLEAGIQVYESIWTYISVTWESHTGNLTLMANNHIMEPLSMSWLGIGSGLHLNIESITFGGDDTNTRLTFDFFRLFDKVRTPEEMKDFTDYTQTFIEHQLMNILFDEGQGWHFTARDKKTTKTGLLKGSVKWVPSSMPTNDILVATPLPPIISNTDAVKDCLRELNSESFRVSSCHQALSPINQVFVENCIKDRLRSRNPGIVKLSGSAFAHYCQGITKMDPRVFVSYLDFSFSILKSEGKSPESKSNTMIKGLVVTVATILVTGGLICTLLFFMRTPVKEEGHSSQDFSSETGEEGQD